MSDKITEMQHLESAARFSHETATRDFRDAAIAGAGFVTAALVAKEALELTLPESSLKEAATSGVMTLGFLAASTAFGAGSIAAAYWRYDEIKHLRAIKRLNQN